MATVHDEYPEFLRLIDSDPKRAADEFYRYAMALFESRLPRILRSFDSQSRADMIMEVILHCLKGDFRVLRKYEPQGKPWAGWFYMVANNKIRDLISSSESRETGGFDESGRPIEEMESGAGASNPGSTSEGKMALDLVNSLIDELDEQCRVLLRLIAEEYRPREIVLVLGLPKEEAKSISGKVIYCQEKLEKLLSGKDLTIDDLLEDI